MTVGATWLAVREVVVARQRTICRIVSAGVPMPPSERQSASGCGGPRSGGRRLRNEGFKKFSSQRILPHPTPSGAFGPGRKRSLLPASAKNMPQAYFLNASRPPGGGLTQRRNNAAYRSVGGYHPVAAIAFSCGRRGTTKWWMRS